MQLEHAWKILVYQIQTQKFQKVPCIIQEEIFDADRQKDVAEIRCRSLNADQEYAFSAIMKTVYCEDLAQRRFYPRRLWKTFCFEALLSRV